MRRQRRSATCPRCGHRSGIPIFYGMPARPPDYVIEVPAEAAEPFATDIGFLVGGPISVYRTDDGGESASGGCDVGPARWRCKGCGYAW